ncbi:hypothetical protein N7509_013048 [Penicillium cosmopolitanum]|uniref:Uncharacterized protein n=1 Tax=Penicillium cosmopolitanum TaxID=1131564 RepID=A0A9W9SCJ0_9EURO|nr:uncharacterized protein N7509_013048 [Penicillium cosmopolitanum]KAJ5376162.1 hypothetical protein N7509_013048 [Penicillium cosmopolitanum]
MDLMNAIMVRSSLYATDVSSPYNEFCLNSRSGLHLYMNSVLQDIQARGFNILHILGFSPPNEGYYFEDSLRCLGHESDPRPIEEEKIYPEAGADVSGYCHGDKPVQDRGLVLEALKSLARLSWRKPKKPQKPDQKRIVFKSSRGQYIQEHCEAEYVDRLRYYLDDPTSALLQEDLRENASELTLLVQTAQTAVRFASRLAFTDWDQTMRTMSTRAFSRKSPAELQGVTMNFYFSIGEIIWLCWDGITISHIEKSRYTEDWIGLDIGGAIILRQAALPAALYALKGRILGLRRGAIMYERQRFVKIRTENSDADSQDSQGRAFFWPALPQQNSVQPHNAYPSIRSRSLFTTLADAVWFRFDVLLSPDECVIGNGSLAASFIPYFLITISCEHGYEREMALAETKGHLVSRNMLGQWLSFHILGTRHQKTKAKNLIVTTKHLIGFEYLFMINH